MNQWGWEGRGYRLEDREGLTSRRTEEGRRIPGQQALRAHRQFTVMISQWSRLVTVFFFSHIQRHGADMKQMESGLESGLWFCPVSTTRRKRGEGWDCVQESDCGMTGQEFKLGKDGTGSAGKESAYNMGDLGSIPGWGRSPGEGNGYLPQYSSLENSMDWGSMGSQRVGHDWATHF